MLDAVIDPEKVKIYRPSEIVARKTAAKGGEHRNFLDCVKSRKPCYAPAETGHRTITIPHIGNIAMQLGPQAALEPRGRAIRRRRRGRRRCSAASSASRGRSPTSTRGSRRTHESRLRSDSSPKMRPYEA